MENLGRYLIGFANILMVLTSLFLICLVLIQRGKGGGLAGAFGGAGGSSAFGTKAGDVFTRVTIIVAGFWFLLAMLLVYSNNRGGPSKFGEGESATSGVDLGGRESSLPDRTKLKKIPPADPTPPGPGKDVPSIPPVTPSDKSTAPVLPELPPETSKKAAPEAAPVVPPTSPKS